METRLSSLGAGVRWLRVRCHDVAATELTGSRVEAQRRAIVELLERELGGAPLCAIKDPRICRLLPFWLETLRSAGLLSRDTITSVIQYQ